MQLTLQILAHCAINTNYLPHNELPTEAMATQYFGKFPSRENITHLTVVIILHENLNQKHQSENGVAKN